MKKGFTLAEVLITLGIIGVVAAMTIPTLIQNTNSVKFVTQFKKSISTLSQAGLMAQAQFDVDYAGLSDPSPTDGTCQTQNLGAANLNICGLFNATLAGQTYQGTLGTIKNSSGNVSSTAGSEKGYYYELSASDHHKTTGWFGTDYLVFMMADGSLVAFNKDAKDCRLGIGNIVNDTLLTTANTSSTVGLKNCMGFIDVNGVKTPNKEVQCSDNTATLDPSSSCVLTSVGSQIGDIYPIVFHDGTVEPATNAAKAAISRGKSND